MSSSFVLRMYMSSVDKRAAHSYHEKALYIGIQGELPHAKHRPCRGVRN